MVFTMASGESSQETVSVTQAADLRSMALALTRLATDSRRRSELDDVIAAFGFGRSELTAETVETLSPEEAMQAWEQFITGPRD